ncbi:hypothetical protein XENOCAPTIV_015984 [Xenoophorus captivus]|uniref:Uncharacterized protein n=1 Tax=Xenoophorus captivus TaxID=1517983 RepID=A0ABV0RAB7_9TELE
MMFSRLDSGGIRFRTPKTHSSTLGRGGVHPGRVTGPSQETWRHSGQTTTSTLTPKGNLERPIKGTVMLLGRGTKLEYPERTHSRPDNDCSEIVPREKCGF